QPGECFRWKGRDSYDLNSRETLETRLGVFAQFQPRIPETFRDAKYVFLGNIDPELQLNVLDQVKQPKLVACDTMNYWIQGKKDLLLQLLRHIDILMVNDSEARELSGDWNIYRAAHWILGRGPKMVVIKQGEHGALLVDPTTMFKVPAYPLQAVFDPTGAGFGGMVRVPAGYQKPVLVMSTDGVGSKVLVAAAAGIHDTVGEDLVNHSVNDILVHGATPLAFLDYIATGNLVPEIAAQIVSGVARGCRAHDMTLAGGETAQMPDLYQAGHYDLAGSIVGVVEEDKALHGDRVTAGDQLIGYASTGLHTN